MDVPPYQSPRRNRTSTIVWVIIGVAACCCLCLVGGFFMAGNWVKGMAFPFAACGMNLQQLRDATLDYAKDHKGKLPDAGKWKQEIWSYYEKRPPVARGSNGQFTRLTQDGDWGCSVQGQSDTVFVYNSDLSGKKVDDVKDKYDTRVFFEAPPGSPTAAPYKSQNPATAPAIIMGKSRGWFDISLEGDPMLNPPGGQRTPIHLQSTGGGGGIEINTPSTTTTG
jgi:hypothetical protein